MISTERSGCRVALLLALGLAACSDDDAPALDTSDTSETGDDGETGPTPEELFCPAGFDEVEARVDALLADLSLEEKVALMAGTSLDAVDGLWPASSNAAAGLPGFLMVDGPRGVSIGAGNATAFPVGSARGATWDPALEHRVGVAMAKETRAKGASVLLAPTVNILRHPRWGRSQETYGEEPFLIGRMGVGFIGGVQSQSVLASVKHFAVNSIEDTRFTVDVSVDERTLREVYLEPFEMAVRDAQVASVMTAYNLVNGAYCAENVPLVREILKGDWGFLGFVESDWVFGTRSTLPSLAAGLDIEMPNGNHYGPALRNAALDGTADPALIDDAVRRIARAQWCYALDSDPPQVDPSAVETAAHLDLAREVAERSLTLLRNEAPEGASAPALPLGDEVARIVVTGELADVENIGDVGSSNVGPSEIVTALEGLQAAGMARGIEVERVATPGGVIDAAAETAIASADAVVLVTGLTADDEGEGFIAAGDRTSMQLGMPQIDRIQNVAALNARTIVVLQGGSSLEVDPWFAQVPALLMAWYPGARGGEALARVLFGEVDPGGRTPVSWPLAEDHLPEFVNDADAVSYGYWHGYRHLERQEQPARFAFGHGLSYASFELSELQVDAADDGGFEASVTVTNDAARAGRTVVQLYVGQVAPTLDRPVQELEAFEAVELAAGESRELSFEVSARQLSVWSDGAWSRPPGDYRVHVAFSSADAGLEQVVALD